MECGWNEKTSASGLEPCGVMSDQTRTLKTACRCAQFCHVAHVVVRRVILVHIVHNGLNECVEGVLVVKHTFYVAICS